MLMAWEVVVEQHSTSESGQKIIISLYEPNRLPFTAIESKTMSSGSSEVVRFRSYDYSARPAHPIVVVSHRVNQSFQILILMRDGGERRRVSWSSAFIPNEASSSISIPHCRRLGEEDR